MLNIFECSSARARELLPQPRARSEWGLLLAPLQQHAFKPVNADCETGWFRRSLRQAFHVHTMSRIVARGVCVWRLLAHRLLAMCRHIRATWARHYVLRGAVRGTFAGGGRLAFARLITVVAA